jgi:hypothetical protein
MGKMDWNAAAKIKAVKINRAIGEIGCRRSGQYRLRIEILDVGLLVFCTIRIITASKRIWR